jgi:hypothetical protein
VGYTLMLSRQSVAPLEGERADWNTTSKCHARRLEGSVLTPPSSQVAVVKAISAVQVKREAMRGRGGQRQI